MKILERILLVICFVAIFAKLNMSAWWGALSGIAVSLATEDPGKVAAADYADEAGHANESETAEELAPIDGEFL